MPVIYEDDVKQSRLLAVRDKIDAGGGPGVLEICSAAYAAVLATIVLGSGGANTGTVSGTTLTLAGFPRSDTAADASGTAALARIRNSAGGSVLRGLTVGVGAGFDVQLDSVNITGGQTVKLNSASITHAA